MPRKSRVIAIGLPHHVTQRGNYRQAVFDDAGDYDRYLKWLGRYAVEYGLDVWAYCLMPNHIHLVAVPREADSLAATFRTVHMQYAQYVNKKRGATGHLWQGRFFSCVLDELHVYAAVRYVELNPVRNRLVAVPEDYLWSSAKSRITGIPDPILTGRCFLSDTVLDWRQYLVDQNADAQKEVITATHKGHPCGSMDFIRKMEATVHRRFIPHPAGRPRKTGGQKIGGQSPRSLG